MVAALSAYNTPTGN